MLSLEVVHFRTIGSQIIELPRFAAKRDQLPLAHLIHKYEPKNDATDERGLGVLMHHYKRLVLPLSQQESRHSKRPLTVANVTDALRACFDKEIYVWNRGSTLATKRLSIVDFGYVNEVTISNRNVLVSLTMPYPGRETWQGWFSRLISQQVRSRIDDVGDVDISVVRQPVVES